MKKIIHPKRSTIPATYTPASPPQSSRHSAERGRSPPSAWRKRMGKQTRAFDQRGHNDRWHNRRPPEGDTRAFIYTRATRARRDARANHARRALQRFSAFRGVFWNRAKSPICDDGSLKLVIFDFQVFSIQEVGVH